MKRGRRIGRRGACRRPDPDAHYESLEVDQQAMLRPPATISFVVDVITRGSTFLSIYQRLAEAFPQAEILFFAAVRTMSGIDVDPIMSPVEGLISFDGTNLQGGGRDGPWRLYPQIPGIF